MLCVTGTEPNIDAVVRRVETFPDMLHEVRLDCLARNDQNLAPLRPFGPRVIATLRTVQQGGRFDGGTEAYERRIRALLGQHTGLIDVEWSEAPHVRRLLDTGRDRMVLSWHGRADDDRTIEHIARSIAASHAGVSKLALHVDDAAELARLVGVAKLLRRPFVVLGLGPAGQPSRILHACFGSAWTFVSSGAPVPGAPGQLSVDQARSMIPLSGSPIPLGIVGGPHVAHSPGLPIYNRVFRQRGLPYSYVAWPTRRLAASLDLMASLGFRGVSVTMPHKQEAIAHCTRLDDLARRVGAVNSLVREAQGWAGYNTDAGAVRDAIRAAGGRPGQRAAVLGAGGAARAAAVALATDGFRVDVVARNEASMHDLATDIPGVSLRPWDAFDTAPYPIVINATPVGSNGADCPLPASSNLAGRIVMDMIHTPEATPLVTLARKQGARVVTGRDMWLRQGLEQMRLFIGLALDPQELARAWPDPPRP